MIGKVLTASYMDRVSDEDLCSQFTHVWTTMILVAMGLGISMVQYVGDPIHCWCPAQMPEAHCNYTKALCWVKQNSYYDIEEPIPFQKESRTETLIAYYPWVPWILFCISAVLKLPHIMWQSFVPNSGLNLGKLIFMADTDESSTNLATIIRIWLVRTTKGKKNVVGSTEKLLGSLGLFWFGRNHRTYLTGLVIWVKMWYLLTSIAVFISLNFFIDSSFLTYGYDVMLSFMHNIPLDSATFPKQTICDIEIRQMANVHTYSIQCILPINLYNEYIFVFLWFWCILLMILNSYSFLKWAHFLLSPSKRRAFVKNYSTVAFRFSEKNKSKPFHITRHSPAGDDSASASSPLLGNNESGADNPLPERRPRRRNLVTSLISSNITNGGPAVTHLSSIETNEDEEEERSTKGQINRMTSRMLRNFGHDGVLVFRVLEASVGCVVANQVFQDLYEQMNRALHYL